MKFKKGDRVKLDSSMLGIFNMCQTGTFQEYSVDDGCLVILDEGEQGRPDGTTWVFVRDCTLIEGQDEEQSKSVDEYNLSYKEAMAEMIDGKKVEADNGLIMFIDEDSDIIIDNDDIYDYPNLEESKKMKYRIYKEPVVEKQPEKKVKVLFQPRMDTLAVIKSLQRMRSLNSDGSKGKARDFLHTCKIENGRFVINLCMSPYILRDEDKPRPWKLWGDEQ